MYESFFGLGGNPFRLSPDPAFLFESRGHSKAHAYLRYGVSEGEGFIVVTGEIGAGKTTLCQALIRELDPERVVAATLVSTQLEADDLLRAVAIGFGLAVGELEKTQLLEAIRSYLIGLAREGRRALLIIDEAQNLSARALEELRMLSNFQDGDRSLLQCFLLGQPELRTIMRAPAMQQLCQRVIASSHLGPLDPDETGAYIEHRLRNVAWRGDPSFDADLFKALHQASGGIPRRINGLCNRLLIRAYLERSHRIGARDLQQVVAEMRDELGPPPAQAAAAAPAAAGQPNNPVRPFVMSAIAARLDALERNVKVVTELVRGVVAREQNAGRLGGRARRT